MDPEAVRIQSPFFEDTQKWKTLTREILEKVKGCGLYRHLNETGKALADWIDDYIRAYPYGEIQAVIKIHDGKISLIERSATERIKPDAPGGSYEKRNPKT